MTSTNTTETVTLQSVLALAIQADLEAASRVTRLQRELVVAQANADQAAAERARVEALARGTGQVFMTKIGFGPSNGGGMSPEEGFGRAIAAGRIPAGAQLLCFTDVSTAGVDPSRWGGCATAHYLLPV